jgi:hypothetical protein
MGCVAQLMTTGRLQCVVNVAAGQETKVPSRRPIAWEKFRQGAFDRPSSGRPLGP